MIDQIKTPKRAETGLGGWIATYPDVNWKEGKLLNRATKKDLEDWVKK